MSQKENGDEAAVAMVRKRWDNTSPEKRTAHARMMARARWGQKKTVQQKRGAKR
jgi:hypothetical protein